MGRAGTCRPCGGRSAGGSKTIVDIEDLRQRLEIRRIEHRDLDHAIAALLDAPVVDQLQIARMKRSKLRLRDEIAWLEDQMIPDIIA